jgi:hypothetical protein
MSASTAITKPDVEKARGQLRAMQGSLADWLRYRAINDQWSRLPQPVKSKLPGIDGRQIAQAAVRSRGAHEYALAQRLHALLSELLPDARLPAADAPGAAVELAAIAITGGAGPGELAQPAAVGNAWLSWPVLIVGGLLVVIVTAIKTAADTAREKEHYACIQSGACTDYGFWLKVGGLAALIYVAWHHFDLKTHVRRALAPGRGH